MGLRLGFGGSVCGVGVGGRALNGIGRCLFGLGGWELGAGGLGLGFAQGIEDWIGDGFGIGLLDGRWGLGRGAWGLGWELGN